MEPLSLQNMANLKKKVVSFKTQFKKKREPQLVRRMSKESHSKKSGKAL